VNTERIAAVALEVLAAWCAVSFGAGLLWIGACTVVRRTAK
jgi:hypothetical protein